jgi:hypothetical protein
LKYKLTIPAKIYISNYLKVAKSILAEVLLNRANRPAATIVLTVRRPSTGTGFFKMTRRSIGDILLVNESAAGSYEKSIFESRQCVKEGRWIEKSAKLKDKIDKVELICLRK